MYSYVLEFELKDGFGYKKTFWHENKAKEHAFILIGRYDSNLKYITISKYDHFDAFNYDKYKLCETKECDLNKREWNIKR